MTIFGADIGVSPTHAQTMKARDSVPPKYWLRMEESASRHGIIGVTVKALADISSSKAGLSVAAPSTRKPHPVNEKTGPS